MLTDEQLRAQYERGCGPGIRPAIYMPALRAVAAAARAEALAESGNYVCDHDTLPQRVEFANGRIVEMRGQGFLFVGLARSDGAKMTDKLDD